MKVYEFGEQGKPVLMLLPGTGCYWRSNFGKVIEPLAETFRVACVSYDGFDETEQTQFPTMRRRRSRNILRNTMTGKFVRRTAAHSAGHSLDLWQHAE